VIYYEELTQDVISRPTARRQTSRPRPPEDNNTDTYKSFICVRID